jgi:hypothetical protein
MYMLSWPPNDTIVSNWLAATSSETEHRRVEKMEEVLMNLMSWWAQT